MLQYQLRNSKMLQWTIVAALVGLSYLLNRYYFRPRAQIQQYKAIFQKLGYSVYEQQFSFMGFSIEQDYQKGLKACKDTRYIEKTIGPQVDVFLGNVIDKPYIMLLNPDLIKSFFSNDSIQVYEKYKGVIKATKQILGNGLIFNEGEQWKQKRKLLSKVFNYDLLKGNISKMNEICNKSFDEFQNRGKISQNRFSYLPSKAGAKMFNGVMMKCFFGYDNLNEIVGGKSFDQFLVETMSQASQISETALVTFFGTFGMKLGLTSRIRKINRNLRLMRQKGFQILKKRTDQVKGMSSQVASTDIIQALVFSNRNKEKGEFQYTDNQFIDEFHTFLVAGTGSLSQFFAMMIYYLGNNPSAQATLRKEINQVIKSSEDITYQNLKKLTFTDWVQLQTTRLFDVSNGLFTRIALKDNYIKDVPITKGTLVVSNPYGTQYSEKHFKEPFAFRPERFEKQCNELHPYALMAFGGGPKNCIGKHLALLSSKIALVNFIKRYEQFQVPSQLTMTSDIFYEAQPFAGTFTKYKQ